MHPDPLTEALQDLISDWLDDEVPDAVLDDRKKAIAELASYATDLMHDAQQGLLAGQ